MKSVRQALIIASSIISLLLLASCSQKANDLLSESSTLKGSVQIRAAAESTVGSQSASVTYEISYTNVLDTTLTLDDVIMEFSGTASCTKSLANVTGNSAQVILSQFQGDGVIRFRIAAGTAIDVMGGLVGASSMSRALTVDNSGITTSSFNILPGAYSVIPSTLDVYFPEPVVISTEDDVFTVSGTCSGVAIDSVDIVSTSATIHFSGTENCQVGETVILVIEQDYITDALGNEGVGNTVAVYTVTDTGPTSGTYSPASSVVRSSFNSFNLSLPGFIDPATVDASDFVVSGTCSSVQVSSASLSGSDVSVQLAGVDSCLNGETVVITTDLSGINDISGNLGQGVISVTYTLDTLAPQATLSVSSGVMAVLPTSLDVVFSTDTNMDSLSAANFEISGSCTAAIDSVNVVGQTVTLSLSGTDLCSAESTVTISVRLDGVMDSVGNTSSGSLAETYTQQ